MSRGVKDFLSICRAQRESHDNLGPDWNVGFNTDLSGARPFEEARSLRNSKEQQARGSSSRHGGGQFSIKLMPACARDPSTGKLAVFEAGEFRREMTPALKSRAGYTARQFSSLTRDLEISSRALRRSGNPQMLFGPRGALVSAK